MSQCDPQIFQGVTQERFACIVTQAEAATGLVLNGNSGQAEAKGIRVEWEFDPMSETLTIHCLDKPFFLPCGMIATQVEQVVNGCP